MFTMHGLGKGFSSIAIGSLLVAVASGACSKQTIVPPETPQALLDKGIAARESGDDSTAFEMFNKACQLTNSAGCNELAKAYLLGKGVTKDAQKAADLFQQACTAGQAVACIALAEMYEKGTVLIAEKEKYGKYMMLLVEGCKHQNADACKLLDEKLAESNNLELKGESLDLFREACKLGSNAACRKVQEAEGKADPGCEELCKTIGYCTMKNGECQVGRVEHCRHSNSCINLGKCSIQAKDNDDGTTFFICTALTDDDCKNAEICKAKGMCKPMDGFCTNPEDESMKKYRTDKIRDIRKMLYDVAKNCDQVKGEVLAAFKAEGYPPSKSWSGLVSDPEVRRQLTNLKLANMDNFRAVQGQIDGDEDLIGPACVQALSDANKKAEDDCLYNGKRQNLKWIRTAGKAECEGGPSGEGGGK